jgi:hypothetical protein
MKTSVVAALLIAFECCSEPYHITLLPGQSFDLAFGSAAEVVCAYNLWSTRFPTGQTKDLGPVNLPYVCAGPVLLSCKQFGPSDAEGFVTFKITPGPSDPLKTLVVPPTTNTVRVVLQSSVNLVDWVHAAAVVLTNPPSATFFRTVIEPEKR